MANTWGELSWSAGSWGEQNDISVSLTGQQLNCAQASVTTTEELNAGWGRETGWGTLDWGDNSLSIEISLTGQQLNIAQGDESTQIDITPNISGEALNSALGAVDPSPDESLVGQQVNLGLGSVAAGTNVAFNVTGLGLNIAQGDESVDNITFATPSGEQLNTNTGSPVIGGIARIIPTGVEAAISTPGNVSFSITGSVIPTGTQVNIAQGTAVLDANTIVAVTGQQLNTTTGTVTFQISASVQLTGNQVNIALGDEVSQVWTIVDTGDTVAYTEVTTGTSVSWNDIDTAA